MNNNLKVVIIAPHWNTPGYVGNLRITRIVRWLFEEGFHVKIIRAGLSDRKESYGFGEVITIRDPLKMHADVIGAVSQSIGNADSLTDTNEGEKPVHVKRKPNKFRRWLSYFLLIPDPGIVWARRAIRHPLVLDACKGSGWFLASSPPESAFIAASGLAIEFHGKFIMDMRDGWLDEPMKPLLRTSLIQRWRERRLERKMQQNAHSVLLTSDHWKTRFITRYPAARFKTIVLTNAYPPDNVANKEKHHTLVAESTTRSTSIRFLYAGRIFSSRPGRKISYLLDPILAYARENSGKAEIIFLGDLIPEEEELLKQWKERFIDSGWDFTRIQGISHLEALKLMNEVDVMLLLSASQSAVPAKFYDYVYSGKPIFAATISSSALAEFGKNIFQYYGYSYDHPESAMEVFRKLMHDIKHEKVKINRPEQFEEAFLKPMFLSIFQK